MLCLPSQTCRIVPKLWYRTGSFSRSSTAVFAEREQQERTRVTCNGEGAWIFLMQRMARKDSTVRVSARRHVLQMK